ncbi:MAG: hypothetical protein ACK4VZ_02265 [Paracoccaceae bacterium]
MQADNRDAEKMAKIWRFVKGFPQLVSFEVQTKSTGLFDQDAASIMGQLWPSCDGDVLK